MVIVQRVPVELPPEARKPCPELTPKATESDLPEDVVFDRWSSDRTARNVCEERRAAAIAAIDAAGGAE